MANIAIVIASDECLNDTGVVAAESHGLYCLWVRFADGTESVIGVESYLDDPDCDEYYEPWRVPGFFDTVRPGRWGVGRP